MMKRTDLFLALAALVLPVSEAQARKAADPVDTYERATSWVPVQSSMTDLLNAGWTIVGFNDYETEMFSDNHASYTFVLRSGNKYVLCYLVDPALNDAKSKCRALN